MYSKDQIPNQIEGEKVILFLRRHWVVVARMILTTVVLLAIAGLMDYAFNQSNYAESSAASALFFLLLSAYVFFVITFTFTNFIDYYLDVWIITTRRVVCIEQKGLFTRQVSEKDLGRMQDITSETKGFGATVFGYGDVHIQTAGEEQRFIFKQVPDAEEISRQISNLVSSYRREHYEYPEKPLKTEEENE
jgi:uncharacterized membrane protein YdbT with pleckstrin-like domain